MNRFRAQAALAGVVLTVLAGCGSSGAGQASSPPMGMPASSGAAMNPNLDLGSSLGGLPDELASLLPGHPRVASQQSLAAVPAQGPSDHLTLPAATPGGQVSLGPGQPRLVMFFASWLSEVSDLRSKLLQGSAYAAAARQEHLPQLVAVDETVVEPSAQAVRSYLAGLGQPLTYPVGLDTTGRVADGYGVQDQPWFVLVSASGRPVWSHDGWLPLPALESAVRHAVRG
jgi:hypothetical protein